MSFTISGANFKIGASLQEYVTDKLSSIVEKYKCKIGNGHVVFRKDGSRLYCVEIDLSDGKKHGIIIKSNGKASDIYVAFDISFSALENQLRKHKGRLRDLMDDRAIEFKEATKHVIEVQATEEDVYPEKDAVITAEKPVILQKLSIEDAIAKMDLANLPALPFINISTGKINFVYYRKDGDISWIECHE